MRSSNLSNTINQSGASGHYGFLTFDALFSILPVVLLLTITMQLAFNIERSAVHSETQQRTFNALVSLADYTVRSGAVVHTETISYPNWIDEHEITSGYVERLRIASGLTELSIAFEPSDRGICIYRIVVVAKEPKQLFFCGD